MKPARPLLIALVAIAVVAIVAGSAAMLPSVQGWAARRALEGESGLDLTFEGVSVTPFTFKARGMAFRKDGIEVKIGSVFGEYSLWQFFANRRIDIRHVHATNVTVDASHLGAGEPQAGAIAAPAVMPGVLAKAELPYEIVLGKVLMAGSVLLPGPAGGAPFPGEFKLEGGGIAPGTEGSLRMTATINDPSPGARVRTLRANMSVQVLQSQQRTFDRAAITLVVDAEGAQFADQNQLRVNAEMSRSEGAERYSASIDTLLGSDTDHLLSVNATLPGGGTEMEGDWSLQVRDGQIQPFFLGGALPEFAAEGAGHFTLKPSNGAVTFAGRLRTEAKGLEVAAAELHAIGAVVLESEFDLARDAQTMRLNRLRARLDGAKPVLAFEISQPVAMDLDTWRFDVGAPAAPLEIAQLSLTELPLAWIRPFVSGVDISGDSISGDFSILVGNSELQLAPKTPVRVRQLSVARGGETVVDRADIIADVAARLESGVVRAQVKQFSMRALGGDEVSGNLEFDWPMDPDERVSARGSLNARKHTAQGSLAPVAETMQLRLSGDVTIGKGRLDVKAFAGEVRDGPRDRVLISAETDSLSLDLVTMRLIDVQAGRQLGRLFIGPWPLATLGQLFGVQGLNGEFSGGSLLLTAASDHLRLHAADPLQFSGLSLEGDGGVMLQDVSFGFAPEITYASVLDWKIALGKISLRNGGGAQLATLGGEIRALGLRGLNGGITFDADLPAMASQPLFSGAQGLASGRASGEMRVAVDQQALQAEARATLNGLVAHDSAVKLPVANLSFRVVRRPDGHLSIDVPFLLDRLGQRSELRIAAEASSKGEGYSFTGKLTGDRVDLPDVIGVLGLLGAPVESIGAASAGSPDSNPVSPLPDAKPFWSGLEGELQLDVKSLTNGPDWSVANIGGVMRVDPMAITLRDVAATLNQKSNFTARGHVAFTEGMRPYRVGSEFSLTDFDLGAFLKSFDPERPPAIEGVFAIEGKFGGSGHTFSHALDQARGQFHMTGRNGIFRGLKRASEKVSVATKAVELGAALGSLFGSTKVKEAAEKVAGQSYQVDQLAQALGEFPFDQLVIRTMRDESLDVKIEELSLISPEVRLVGTGGVTYEAGVPILDQRLNVTYAISARGKIEKLLEKLKVLDGNRDDLGYSTTREKGVIGGTLAKPDASSYFIRLAESKFADFLSPD